MADDWEKQYKTLAIRCGNLEEANRALSASNAVLEAEKRQWTADKARWEAMVQKNLGSSDGQRRDLENTIIDLRREIKVLKAEVN